MAISSNLRAFKDFVSGLATSASLGATDGVPIVQGGQTRKWLPFNYFLNRDASNANTAGTARGNLSAMGRDAADASLPTARNNLLYTPPSCDGYTAADGAITTGTTAFTVTTGVFTAADVGKLISIRKAGAKSFMNGATVSSGGAGHIVGDLVNFADGIQIYVKAVSGGAITKFYIVNRGSAAAPGATIAQTSSVVGGSTLASPVAGGTGAVLTPTWFRENLVTTIAAYVSPTAVTLADQASATVASPTTWGYGTDYGPVIQAALSSNLPVVLPPGICGHATQLTLSTGDALVGQVPGSSNTAGTTLMWLGAPNTAQVFLGTQAGSLQLNMQFGRLRLDGLGSASKGIYARGAGFSNFPPMVMRGHTTVGVDIHGNDNDQDSINNRWEHLSFTYETSDLNTSGMWLGFPNTYDIAADTDLSHYQHIQVKTIATAPGLIAGAADHNTFVYIQTRAGTNWDPPGVDMLSGNWVANGHFIANHFMGMDAGAGGVHVDATGTFKPQNFVDFYDRYNGGADFLVEDGASLPIRTSSGLVDGLVIRPRSVANLATVTEGGVSYVTNSTTKTPGAIIGTGGTYRVPVFYDGTDWRVSASIGTKATANIAAQAPASTASTSYVMMGCGATATITPGLTGTVLITAVGYMRNTTANDGVKVRLKHGTGAAPANGAAETGTSSGAGAPLVQFQTTLNNQEAPFSVSAVVTGLTPGTAVWMDLAAAAVTGGVAELFSVSFQAAEL